MQFRIAGKKGRRGEQAGAGRARLSGPLKRGGWVRCEVKVGRDDVELIRTVAAALRDPDRHAATRALLRDCLGAPRPRGFKELLASCPVDLDLDRSRDLGRDVEI